MKTLNPVELSGNTLKPPKAWYHRNAKKLSDRATFVLGGKAHNVISFFLLLLIFFFVGGVENTSFSVVYNYYQYEYIGELGKHSSS
jgi:hypothetical protein